MSEPTFTHDVFLSHSSKDKAVVRELAARLKGDGVRVWLDEEQIRPGDSIPAKIEEGLEYSRVLVLCMSANAFGSDWAQLEAGTFRFRDPLNKERRFLPLRLDDAPIKGSLAQFLYINWLPASREQEYGRLIEACTQPQEVGLAIHTHPAPVKSATQVPPKGDLHSTLESLARHTGFFWAELVELPDHRHEFATEMKESTFRLVNADLTALSELGHMFYQKRLLDRFLSNGENVFEISVTGISSQMKNLAKLIHAKLKNES